MDTRYCSTRIADSFQSMSNWNRLEDIHDAIAGNSALTPHRRNGPACAVQDLGPKIPRAPHRFSGRTALPMLETIHEPQPPDDPESPLAFSMEGHRDNHPPCSFRSSGPPAGTPTKRSTSFRMKSADRSATKTPASDYSTRNPAGSSCSSRMRPRCDRRNNQLLLVPIPDCSARKN